MPDSAAHRTVLVTGATAGIGLETARALARMGAQVVMVARDRAKGEAVMADIKSQTGNQQLDLLLADMSSQASVNHLADEVLSRYPRLDVLVNNAGGVFTQRKETVDGLEYTFALNHLGYFLLTNRLLDRLKGSAPARIVNVASEAGRMGTIRKGDLMGESKYSGWRAYAQSKLANIIFTYDLARRLAGTGVTVNAVHPGGVATNFATNNGGFFQFGMKLVRPFMLTAEQGADTVIFLASAPEVEGITGKYWAKRKQIRSNRESYDEAVWRRLWDVSEKLTGL